MTLDPSSAIPCTSARAASWRVDSYAQRVPGPLIQAILAAVIMLCGRSGAAPASLDTTFNGTGKVTNSSLKSASFSRCCVAQQSDGKLVVAAVSTTFSPFNTGLARYNANGTLDTTFNGTGLVSVHLGHINFDDLVRDVVIQPGDQKIIVVGSIYNGSNYDLAISRFDTNGTLDTTFNGTGKNLTPISAGDDHGRAVAIQSDGKIVVAGMAQSGSIFIAAAVRYNTNGTLDTTFGGGGTGKMTTTIEALSTNVGGVAIQPADQKIVIAGSTSPSSGVNHFGALRLSTSGLLDSTFDGDGKVFTVVGTNGTGTCMALQSDGKIVVGGYENNGVNLAMVRYQTNGSLDTSFNGTGIVLTNLSGSATDSATAIAMQSDGKILLAGYSSQTTYDYALARYTSGGILDTSFNGTGYVTTDVSTTATDFGLGVIVQADKKIVVSGDTGTSLGLVRYVGDFIADADSDGLLDSWELAYWPSTTGHSAADDFDKDGYNELLELGLGLNPTLASAGGLPAAINEGGYLTMTITKQAGVTYEVQSAGSLLTGAFSPATTTVITNNATTLKVRDTVLINTGAARFMRAKVTAAP